MNKVTLSALKWVLLTGVALVVGLVGVWVLWWFNLWPFVGRAYTMDELGITTVVSTVDFDRDGEDDYRDLLLGARKDAENHPRYDGSYVQGGYPGEDTGVCTDVIWRAFREAGYDLKAMVDADITARQSEYGIETPDSDIDFRRVKNLETFLAKYAVKLSNDWQENLGQWQPGDIVVFDDGGHIGVVSDRRTKEGRPYIIHNAGQPIREEDYLKRGKVTGHYRFDASRVDAKVLKEWGEG